MTAARRWCLAALVTAVVIAVPQVGRLLPATESDLDAGELFALVAAAEDHPYSGYVETTGTLQLPVSDRFDSAGALFGESNRLRVWWRGRQDWRVARLLAAGENDLVHAGRTTTEYDYEDAAATTSVDPEIRLPRTADLLPPEVARRFLGGVESGDVTRLPARRVAGISAPGLRVEGDAARSSIRRVDLWADPDTGVPLRVEVLARGSDGPDFTSRLRRVRRRGTVARGRVLPCHPADRELLRRRHRHRGRGRPVRPAPAARHDRRPRADLHRRRRGRGVRRRADPGDRDPASATARRTRCASRSGRPRAPRRCPRSGWPWRSVRSASCSAATTGTAAGWSRAPSTRPVLRQAAVDLIRDSVVLEYRR